MTTRQQQFNDAWKIIKNNSPRSVTLRIHRLDLYAVVNGIQKQKSAENVARRSLNLPAFGQMKLKIVDIDSEFKSVTFRLTVDGSSL